LIKSLSIKNFRGIKEGKIENLGQVNIFIGGNNSGKSTLLDLLCFIKAPLKPTNELGEFVLESLLQRRVEREVSDEIEFFHEYLAENEVEVRVTFDDGVALHLKALHQDRDVLYSLLLPGSADEVARFRMAADGNPHVWTPRRSGTFNNPLLELSICYRTGPLPDKANLWDYAGDKRTLDDLEFISRIALVDADFVRKIERIEDAYWADILKRRSDKQLKMTLNQTYGLPIEGFSFANYRNGRSKIFAMLPEISMHIDDYGDGFRYAFSILTIASQIRNTALLLEEPEVHQHEGALRPLFDALKRLASKNKLQIFISTHNPNILRIWTQLTQDVRIYHLDLGSDGKLEARQIAGADAKLMMDLGASPLRLDEPFEYLVLEGKEDRIFFESVARKLKKKDLKSLGFEVLLCPKDEQKTTIAALVSTGKPIISCIDFDKKSNPEDLIKPFLSSLTNKYKEVKATDNKIYVTDTGSRITFIPTGLPDDRDLSGVGITKYSMEDHILKLLSTDNGMQKWVEMDLRELRNRAQSLKDKVALNSSKALLMTLGVIKGGETLEKLIPEIIDKSDPKLLVEALKPFVAQLFS